MFMSRMIKGAAGGGVGGVDDFGKVKIGVSVVSDIWECQLPDAFYRIKKFCS